MQGTHQKGFAEGKAQFQSHQPVTTFLPGLSDIPLISYHCPHFLGKGCRGCSCSLVQRGYWADLGKIPERPCKKICGLGVGWHNTCFVEERSLEPLIWPRNIFLFNYFFFKGKLWFLRAFVVGEVVKVWICYPACLSLSTGDQDFTSNITSPCLEMVTSEELKGGGFQHMLQSEVCSAGARELLCQETLQETRLSHLKSPSFLIKNPFLIKNSNLAILKYPVI